MPTLDIDEFIDVTANEENSGSWSSDGMTGTQAGYTNDDVEVTGIPDVVELPPFAAILSAAVHITASMTLEASQRGELNAVGTAYADAFADLTSSGSAVWPLNICSPTALGTKRFGFLVGSEGVE